MHIWVWGPDRHRPTTACRASLRVVANAGFVAAEFALVAVDRARIDERAGQGQARAVAVQRLLGRLSYHLSGAQLGITITSLLLGVLAEPASPRPRTRSRGHLW